MEKRYPCQVVILFILGILVAKGVLASGSTDECRGLLLAAAAAVSAGSCIWLWLRKQAVRRKRMWLFCVLLLAFGLGAARMYTTAAEMERRLSGLWDGQEVSVQGRISKKRANEIQPQEPSQIQAHIKNDSKNSWTVFLTDSYLKTSQEIRYCGDIIVSVSGNPVIGNTILLSGKIKLFQEARNDGNFDERSYYQDQGYALKVSAGKNAFTVADSHTDRLQERLYKLRQSLVQVYQSALPPQEAGVLCAMLTGERSLLSDEVKTQYQTSGLAHILAISGLHISILGMAVFRLLRKGGISYRLCAAASMGLLLLFGTMAGMGISTVRAVVMFGVYLGAACCGRAYDSINGLAAAAVWMLLGNPGYLFLAGFQFSFAAVAGVLLGKELCRMFRPKYRLAETMWISLGIQVLTLPLTAWYYFEVPVYAALLNLIVLPFMGTVLLLGLCGGIGRLCADSLGLWLGGDGLALIGKLLMELLRGCGFLLRYFSSAAGLFSKLPGAVCVTGRPALWQMAGYYLTLLAGILFFAGVRRARDAVSVTASFGQEKRAVHEKRRDSLTAGAYGCLMLCLLLVRLPRQAEVVFLDVGQGDGIYIRTGDGANVMIDGGSTDVKQVGTYRILPFLKARGITRIDSWFFSHLDMDHSSGIQELLDRGFLVGEVVLASEVVKDEAYEKMRERLLAHRVSIRYLKQGDTLRGDQACFQCLAPAKGTPDDRNAGSLVLLYEDSGLRAFFSGDISEREERRLLAGGSLEPVTIYKAAHHGSDASNTKELLEQLHPVVSVISCAKENSYGHPGKAASRRLRIGSGSIACTMDSGQIRIRMRKGRISIQAYADGR